VARALQLVARQAGVTIDKVIPSGGGLGGGSADAGAVLRWAGGVSPEAALTLGGDVPFCQLGGRALVEGAGEKLTALPFKSRKVTLIIPDFAIDTAACYRAYDDWMRGDGSRSSETISKRAPGPSSRASGEPSTGCGRNRRRRPPGGIGLDDVRDRRGRACPAARWRGPRGLSAYARRSPHPRRVENYLPAARRWKAGSLSASSCASSYACAYGAS